MPTRLQIESFGPFVVALLAVGAWCFCETKIAGYFAKELLAALISAAAIAAGFMATALSILLPVSTTETGKQLKKSGYLPHLFSYMRSAIYSCLALAFVCLLAFFALHPEDGVSSIWAGIVIFCAAYSAAALARMAEVLMNIFERASVPEDKDG